MIIFSLYFMCIHVYLPSAPEKICGKLAVLTFQAIWNEGEMTFESEKDTHLMAAHREAVAIESTECFQLQVGKKSGIYTI